VSSLRSDSISLQIAGGGQTSQPSTRSIRMSRWHSVERNGVFIHGYSASPIFYNIKKTLKIITSLSLAPAPLDQTGFLAAAQFSDLFEAWPKVISGELPLWVAHPTAQTDGLNDHLFRGTFSNPNPLTCADGKSEICGSPANISKVDTASGMARSCPSLSSRFRSRGVYI
jgi:hypothetical protein